MAPPNHNGPGNILLSQVQNQDALVRLSIIRQVLKRANLREKRFIFDLHFQRFLNIVVGKA
jgi:hypothetical protein